MTLLQYHKGLRALEEKNYDEVQRIANLLQQNNTYRNALFANTVRSMIKDKQYVNAERIAMLLPSLNRSILLFELGKELVDNCLFDNVKRILEQLLGYAHLRDQLYYQLGCKMIEIKNYDELQQIIDSISNIHLKNELLYKYAIPKLIILVQSGNVQQALQNLDSFIKDCDWDKAESLFEIVRSKCKKEDFERIKANLQAKKRDKYFQIRRKKRLPIYDQIKQTEQEKRGLISRISNAISFLQQIQTQPNLQAESNKFIRDVEFVLTEANNILTKDPAEYYMRKSYWIQLLKTHNVILHDDVQNPFGFFDNLYNILIVIEKLQDVDPELVKKITNRVSAYSAGCFDAKIDMIHRFLIALIDTELPFLQTCATLILEAIQAYALHITRMSKLGFINYLLYRTDIQALFMILQTNPSYREKGAKELSSVLKKDLIQQSLNATNKEKKEKLLSDIIQGLINVQALNEQGDHIVFH